MSPLVAEDDDGDDDGDDMISPMEVESDSEDDSDGFSGALTTKMPAAIAKQCESIYDMFLIHGAPPAEAKEKATELFSPPRVTEHLRFMPHVSLARGSTFDLEADEYDKKWDFSKSDDRARCRQRIVEERPYLLSGVLHAQCIAP